MGASPGSALAGGISIGRVQMKLFLMSGALAGLIGMQQLFADQGFLPAGYEAGHRLHRDRRGVPRPEQPRRDRLRGAAVGDAGSRGDVAAARDRRATRVRHHPAGHLDHVGRRDLPAREATAVRAAAPSGRRGRGLRGFGRRRATSTGSRRRIADVRATWGPRSRIAFTYFTIIYVTGLGGPLQRAVGHREHRPRRHDDHRHRHRLVGDVLLHTDLGWGLPWGPIMGLLIGLIAGALFASIHAARHRDVQGRPDRLGRRDQPGGDRARPVPLHGVLRPGDPIGLGSAAPESHRHPRAVEPAAGVWGGRSAAYRRW